MDPNSPYLPPQTVLTRQHDLSPQDELTTQRVTFPRVLPAIVGVGATITFWACIYRLVSTLIETLIVRNNPNNELDALYALLDFINLWIFPCPFVLGIICLSQVPHESGAKSSFKLSWIICLGHSLWLIVVSIEKEPESIPSSVLWIVNLIGLTYNLALYWGMFQLSNYCKDSQLRRWSVGALILGSGGYSVAMFRYFCDLFGTEYFSSISEEQYQFYDRVFEWLYFTHWALWFPLFYCISRALWRVVAYAEIEARKNTPSPPHAVPTETTQDSK